MKPMLTAGLVLVLMGTGLTGTVLAQEAPLKGPSVKQDRPAGLGGQFAQGREDRKGPMTERVPMRVYAQAVDKLRGEGAPEGLRLSADQERDIRKIEADYRGAMAEYAKRSRGEEKGAEGDGARRARLQELMRNAPDPTDTQVKVYTLLTPKQKTFVEGEVAKSMAEFSQRRSDEYAQRLIKKRQGDGKAPEGDGRERAKRIFEKLQQLPPEERDQVLRRLEEELDRRATNRPSDARPSTDKSPSKP